MGLFSDIFGGGSPDIEYPVLARMNNASQSTVGALTGLITGSGSDAYETNPWGIFSNNKAAQTKLGSLAGGGGGWNLLDVLGKQQGRDLPTMNKMIDFNSQSFGIGNSLIDALRTKINGNTNNIVGMAQGLRKSIMANAGGGYDQAISAATGNLQKTLKNINAGVGAQAVASGVNSGNTLRRSRTQQGNEAQRISEIVGQLGVQKANAMTAADSSSGNMLLSAIGGRAASDEAQTTSMIGQRLGLRGQNIDSTLSLDAQRRNLELDPIQKLMAGVQAVPTWGASPVVSQNPGALNSIANTVGNVAGAVGSVFGLGTGISGFFSDAATGARNVANQYGLLQQSWQYRDPNAAGPLAPWQFNSIGSFRDLVGAGRPGSI